MAILCAWKRLKNSIKLDILCRCNKSHAEDQAQGGLPRRAAAVDARDRLAACAILETDP